MATALVAAKAPDDRAGRHAGLYSYASVQLPVPDPTAAVAWYEKVLGVVRADSGERVIVGSGTVEFSRGQPATPMALDVETTDVVAAYRALIAHVDPVDSPTPKQSGGRCFSVMDPNGYELRFSGSG